MSTSDIFALRTGRGVSRLTGCMARRAFFKPRGANKRKSIPILSFRIGACWRRLSELDEGLTRSDGTA
jgi:hypothetical protein